MAPKRALAVKAFRLMDLPIELRLLVYDSMFQESCPFGLHKRYDLGRARACQPRIDICYVSKFVYLEALPRYYLSSSFYLTEYNLIPTMSLSPIVWSNIRDLKICHIDGPRLFGNKSRDSAFPLERAEKIWDVVANHCQNLRFLHIGFVRSTAPGEMALWVIQKVTRFYVLKQRKPIELVLRPWVRDPNRATYNADEAYSRACKILTGETIPIDNEQKFFNGLSRPRTHTIHQRQFLTKHKDLVHGLPPNLQKISICNKRGFWATSSQMRALHEFELEGWKFRRDETYKNNSDTWRPGTYERYTWVRAA